MRRVTLRGLAARKLRLSLTALAIVLGVTFVTGTLVLGDTLNRTFNNLIGTAYQHVSFEIRGTATLSGADTTVNSTAERRPVPASIATTVGRLPGVAYVHGSVGGYAQFLARNGDAIGGGGGSTLGFSFDPNRQLSPYRLVQGHAPTTPDDVVMDKATATKYHFAVGDRVLMNLPDRAQRFTVTGIVTYGSDDNLAGVTLAGFDLRTAQTLFHARGVFDTISVLARPGADNVSLQRAIARLLPAGVEVVSGQTVANELSTAVDNALGFISTALLIFAAIALFVGAFTIFNTLSITVGQRTRELALLRLVGAGRRQVFRSVLGEAAVTGPRRVGGRPRTRSGRGARAQGAAQGLRDHAAVGAAGVRGPHAGRGHRRRRRGHGALGDHPGAPRGARSRRWRRSLTTAPRSPERVAAPADHGRRHRRRGRDRGRSSPGWPTPRWLWSAWAPSPSSSPRACSSPSPRARCRVPWDGRWPPLLGVPGRLGRENSMRNPRRTAQTAAALMIGLALVSTIAVLGASLSTSAANEVDSAVNADYIVTGSGGFSRSVIPAVSRLPGVTTATTVYPGQFEFRGALSSLAAATPRRPGADRQPPHHRRHAALRRWPPAACSSTPTRRARIISSVGSVVPVSFAQTGPTTMRIGGHLHVQPAGGQLHRRRGVLPRALRQPAAHRGAAAHGAGGAHRSIRR